MSGPLHLFIATSAYQFHPNYTHALSAGVIALTKSGIPVDLCHVADHCHVDDARNAMVRQFLMSRASHLVFIDNDVGFDAESLLRLANFPAEYDMVAGVYPLKEAGEGYPVRVPDGAELWANESGLVEVTGVPTGFLRISRHCIEQMTKAYGYRKFYGRGQSHEDIPHTILFERTYENGVRYSGDYAFCEKWRAIGGKMFVDPEMHFSHSGTYEWTGTLGDYWRRIHGVTEQRFEAAIQRMKNGEFNGEIVQDLIAGWNNPFAANPNTLVACWHAAKKANRILETGSGLTTLVMALANPRADIVSLESDSIFASGNKDLLSRYGIHSTLIYRPLTEWNGGKWYDFEPGSSYDLAVLDGPNRQLGNRNLAFEIIGDAIKDAVVIMDDADDPSLMDAFKKWADDNGRPVSTIGVRERNTAISKVAA